MPTITITGAGDPVTAELPDGVAVAFRQLAELLPSAPCEEYDQEAYNARSKAADAAAKDFSVQMQKLAQLRSNQVALVSTFIDLMNFGEPGLCANENWIWEVIQDLLQNCIQQGIGDALALGPSDALETMGQTYYGFRTSIDSLKKGNELYARALAANQK